MHHKSQKYLFLILLIALFFAQFLYIKPYGEFALNDDWVHTDTILHWAETGQFRLMPYAGPTFYIPILYGTALAKIFGFSFTLLRISTLVLTAFLLSTFYFLLIRLSNKPALAFFGALTLWLNPIFYNLSFTFMTDIPALLSLCISMYLYYLGFESGKNKFLFWGTIFGLLSAFTRQTGILIVLATFFYAITYGRIAIRPYLKNFIISFGLPLAIAGVIYTWLNVYQLLPQNTLSHLISNSLRLLGHIKWWLFYIPMYLGLFSLPLTLPWFIKHHTEWFKKKNLFILFIIVGLTVAIREIWHLQFPYIGNIISTTGIGPINNTISENIVSILPSWGWGIITVFCALGLSLIIYLLSHRHHNNEPTGFIYLFGILYLIPLLAFESFDRYLLPLFLVLIILIVQNIKHVKFSYLTSSILILILIFISLTQTKFYLAWNQTRWQLATQATNLETDKTKIDAGYEWDGWNNYWSTLNNEKNMPADGRQWYERRFFPTSTPEYIVSFSAVSGYATVSEQKIPGYNLNDHLYLLKKNSINPYQQVLPLGQGGAYTK